MMGKLSWVSPGLFVSHIVRELFLMLFDVSLDELRKILERIRQDRDLSVPYEGYFHLMKDLVKEVLTFDALHKADVGSLLLVDDVGAGVSAQIQELSVVFKPLDVQCRIECPFDSLTTSGALSIPAAPPSFTQMLHGLIHNLLVGDGKHLGVGDRTDILSFNNSLFDIRILIGIGPNPSTYIEEGVIIPD